MSLWEKSDRYGQVIKPGDVCARSRNDKVELVIYKEEVFGGKGSKGEYGRFYSLSGPVTIKYSSVVFVCDPIHGKANQSEPVRELVRKYYE